MIGVTPHSLNVHGYDQRVLVYDDGSRYEGQWQEGLRHGQGVYVRAGGDRYEGEWQADRKHGHGVCVYAGGDRYNGEWQEGQRHGRGVYVYASGDLYDGQWQEGLQHGHGVLVCANRDRYDGEWQEGQQQGHGVLVFAGGDRYDGEWQGDRKHGQGVYVYPDGSRHEGLWQNNHREGCFTIRFGEESLTREFERGALKVPTDCSDGNTSEFPLQGRPLHAVVIQSLHDWNQAFKSSLDDVVRSLTACGYEVSVIKIGSTQELTQLRLATKTQLLWVLAHGSTSGCLFAQDPADGASLQAFKPLVQQLDTRPLMVLQSCNTSLLAEQIAREVPGTTVMAPTCKIMYVGIAHTPTTLRITMLGPGKIRGVLATYCT